MQPRDLGALRDEIVAKRRVFLLALPKLRFGCQREGRQLLEFCGESLPGIELRVLSDIGALAHPQFLLEAPDVVRGSKGSVVHRQGHGVTTLRLPLRQAFMSAPYRQICWC